MRWVTHVARKGRKLNIFLADTSLFILLLFNNDISTTDIMQW
jgi:hypothetical protein